MPARRWFQFSIASLIWLTLFVATGAFAFREHRERVRSQQSTLPLRYYLQEGGDLMYYPPGREFKVQREAVELRNQVRELAHEEYLRRQKTVESQRLLWRQSP